MLAPDRGEVGHYLYADSKESIKHYNYLRYSSKKWILNHWGNPDKIFNENGIEYLIYEKRSRDAPNYNMQYLGGERPVKLGYKDNKLIYISAYFKNCPAYMKAPVHVLPK